MPRQVSHARAGNAPSAQRRKKKNKNKNNNNIIPKAPVRDKMNQISELWAPLFPARTTKRLRYSTNTGGLTSASGVTSYVFSANGLYDPDITSIGHQPMGFDQMMVSYEHYTVIYAQMTATFKNTSATFCSIGLSVQPSPTPISTIDTLLEYGALEKDILEYKGVSGSVKTLTTRCDLRKINGRNNIVDDTDLQGSSGANPLEQTYFMVSIWDAGGSTVTAQVDVVIDFTAVFMEPRTLTPSLVKILHNSIIAESKTR